MGFVMADPPFARHSAVVPCFSPMPWISENLPGCGAPYYFPVSSGYLSKPTAVPSRSALKPHFRAPSPALCKETHNSGWGCTRRKHRHTAHECSSCTCLPLTTAAFSSNSLEVPFCLSCFPSVNGLSECKETRLTVSSLPGFLVPFPFLFKKFFSLLSSYPVTWGFSCSSRCLRLSSSVQRVLCENCSTDVFLMYL